MVAAALEKAHALSVEIVAVKTSGDRIQDRPLAEVGGKALWTKELDLALLGGETRISVHSMKDVESERPDALLIAAMLPRADVRDRLIGAASIADLPEGARVGTSSPRRAAQLKQLRPDLEILTLRGNVATRLAKREAGEVDATLLAAAGLDRLGMEGVGSPIPLDTILPAPAQGAIGIECRTDEAEMIAWLAGISDAESFGAVALERAFTRALGGTCHSPVAALAWIEGDAFRLSAALFSEDGTETVADQILLAPGDVLGAASFAEALLAGAPDNITRLFD
jgi:hydroxymethylbilane synthase